MHKSRFGSMYLILLFGLSQTILFYRSDAFLLSRGQEAWIIDSSRFKTSQKQDINRSPWEPNLISLTARYESKAPTSEAILGDTDNVIEPTNNQQFVSETLNKSLFQRKIANIEKFARLPVWPVWNGVFLFLLSKVAGQEIVAEWEQTGWFGGRVCPNFFNPPGSTSPFIMLVHHCHSFAMWDPVRYIQRSFFPEGFPAHPHRGFITVTYILQGGFKHRDSLGVKQRYGASRHGQDKYNGKHTQWLMTGAGLLHEEMWDIECPSFIQPSRQELYQLWLNVPAKYKLNPPKVNLLGGQEETPTILAYSDGTLKSVTDNDSSRKTDSALQSKTIVIAGKYGQHYASIETFSGVDIFHVVIEPGGTWKHSIPPHYSTGIIYMRLGSASVDGTTILPHHTAYLSRQGNELIVTNSSPTKTADFLLLAGEDLNEPVAAQGSMVMNSYDQINQAYQDYQQGRMGIPWSHELSDEKWREHLQKFPSIYKFSDRAGLK